MMMKKILVSAFLLANSAVATLYAQAALQPEWVLGCFGGDAIVGNTLFTFTSGEPIIETIVGANNIVTQGFQQPYSGVVDSAITIWMPTAFTPFHSSGLNDTFKPVYLSNNFLDYKMVVWSRWRLRIFETNSVDEGWNGTYNNEKVPPGVYVWAITFNTLNTTTQKKTSHKKIGVVHLTR